MKRRAAVAAIKSAVVLSLLAPAGCGGARRVYLALTHRIVMTPSESMLPTLKQGDRAAVDEGFYADRPVQRFDLVMYRLARENVSDDMASANVDENSVYLKRVIGLGGETLEIKGGRVYIDGRPLEEPFATVPLTETETFGPVKIPEGEVFLMGDNRPNSLDSRFWAQPTLKKQNILGKVVELLPQ